MSNSSRCQAPHAARRPLLAAFLLVALAAASALPARAAVEVEVEEDGDATSAVTYRLVVTPAPQPVPILKYRLQTHEIELKTGNAAPYYYRSLLALADVREQLEEEFEDEHLPDDWRDLETPVSDLPMDDVRRALAMFEGELTDNLNRAVQCRNCDWQLQYEDLRGPQTIYFSLAELQRARELMRYLAVRARVATADGDYDAALALMRTNLRLSFDAAREPLLVTGLIGIAGAGEVNNSLIELIAAPDSPNLYWALAALPSPLISLREHAQVEANLGLRMIPLLETAETAEHSPEQWAEVYRKICREFMNMVEENAAWASGDAPPRNDFKTDVMATAFGVAGYRHAKERLIAMGYERSEVEVMAVGQVLAIHTAHAYRFFADEMERLWYVPYWEAQRLDYDDLFDRHHPLGSSPHREVVPLAAIMLPAAHVALSAQTRITWDFAALRVIEALRMHAAENDGRLPESLEAVTCVPVPENPATGEPFEYRLDGDEATLDLPEADDVGIMRRFLIRIADETPEEEP